MAIGTARPSNRPRPSVQDPRRLNAVRPTEAPPPAREIESANDRLRRLLGDTLALVHGTSEQADRLCGSQDGAGIAGSAEPKAESDGQIAELHNIITALDQSFAVLSGQVHRLFRLRQAAATRRATLEDDLELAEIRVFDAARLAVKHSTETVFLIALGARLTEMDGITAAIAARDGIRGPYRKTLNTTNPLLGASDGTRQDHARVRNR